MDKMGITISLGSGVVISIVTVRNHLDLSSTLRVRGSMRQLYRGSFYGMAL